VAGLLVLVLASCGPAPGASTEQAPGRSVGRPLQTVRSGGPADHPPVPPPPLKESEPVAPRQELHQADLVARRFFAAYVNFIYGRLAAADVPDVDANLSSRLEHSRALITPAERATTPTLARLTVVAAGPPVSALATAIVLSGRSHYKLTATLEPKHGRWTVVAVDG